MDFTEINEGSARDDGPWGGYDFNKKSLAVVVTDGDDNGCVMWTVGGDIRMLIDDDCLRTLEDFGLYPPSVGIWIWEGSYIFTHDEEGSGDAELIGKFRSPSEEEWAAIKRGECPWNDEEWKLKKEMEAINESLL